MAVQSLLGAVVQARDARQRVEAGEGHRDLIVVAVRVGRVDVADSLFHVVVVDERHEVAGGVAVRAEDVRLDRLALLVHVGDGRGGAKPLTTGLSALNSG